MSGRIDGVPGLPGRKKKEHRELANFVATYHVLPRPLDYDAYVGLVLNQDRVRHQRALEQMLGAQAANSHGALPSIWFDAMAWHPAEADSLSWEVNGQRMEAAALAKRGE